MRKEKISESQAYILIITFIMGTSLALVSYSVAKQDTWISMIISYIMAIPMVIIYGSILNAFPTMDIFQILEHIFGKVFGRIIGFLYTLYFFHLGAICIRNITEFIQIASFPETPQYFTTLFIGILAIYIIKAGLEVIARVSKFVFPLLIFIIMITLVFGMSNANVNNLLPVLENGWSPIIKGGFSRFSFPLGESVIFLAFLNNAKDHKAKKIYLKGISLGSLILLIIIIRNTLILGFPSLTSSIFPSYAAISIITIGKFVRGIGIIIAMVITIGGFIKTSICLLATCIGVSRIFNFGDYKWVAAPIALLMMSVSLILYDSTMEMIDWIHYYNYYAFPFQVVLPIIILIFAKIKNNKKNESLL